MATKTGQIYVGIGGWNFEPWRGVFYPKGLPQAKELEYAASHLTSIEINATFYGSQKPESFRKWAATVPDGFVFSVKGPRFATNRRVLAEAGDSIKRFLNSGLLELGDRLGPLLWQFAPTKKFEADDFGKFLELLPPKSTAGASGTCWKCVTPVFSCRISSPLPGVSARRSYSPTTPVIHRWPTRPAISSTHGCKKERTRFRRPIRRRNSMPGQSGCASGRKARYRRTCRIRRFACASEGHAARCFCLCHPRGQVAHPMQQWP